MPLYEYQCDACSHRFERIRRFSDPPLEACPVCGGTVRKLLSAPAIQFKGSGWYVTDYAKKSSTDGGGNSSSAPSSPGAGESSGKTPTDKGSTAGSSGSTGSSGASGSSSSGSSSPGAGSSKSGSSGSGTAS